MYVRNYIIEGKQNILSEERGVHTVKNNKEKKVNQEGKEEKEILNLYRSLSENQQQHIKVIMIGMKGKVF